MGWGIGWRMPMRFQLSLRKRIIITFCLFCVVLGTVFATAVYISLDYIDDYLVDARLEQEMVHLGVLYQSHTDPIVPTSPLIQAYTGTTSMPSHLKRMVGGISEGVHEKYYEDIEYHIAVKVFPKRTEPLYLFFNVSALEFTETRKFRIGIVLTCGVAFITSLGWWMGLLLSRRVMAPVAHLADQVKQMGPENLPAHLSQSFANDEVGVLAKALEQAVQRIESFVKRERKFTRDASHELRTPVTVIKGAVEIIRKQMTNEEKSVIRPLNRIGRAVADMENIIETFLWLGREEVLEHSEVSCDVVSVVEKVIEQYRILFAEKPIEIELNSEARPILNVPPPLFQAVITNLIKNAYHFTTEGKIVVSVCHDSVAISDTGSGIEPCDLRTITQPYVRGDRSRGFGVGLAIVKRLCRRFGWQFEIESASGKGTIVYLYFRSPQNQTV